METQICIRTLSVLAIYLLIHCPAALAANPKLIGKPRSAYSLSLLAVSDNGYVTNGESVYDPRKKKWFKPRVQNTRSFGQGTLSRTGDFYDWSTGPDGQSGCLFRWRQGKVACLATLNTSAPLRVAAVNSNETIAGVVWDTMVSPANWFLYQGGVITVMKAPDGYGSFMPAVVGIDGSVTGTVQPVADAFDPDLAEAFTYKDGIFTKLLIAGQAVRSLHGNEFGDLVARIAITSVDDWGETINGETTVYQDRNGNVSALPRCPLKNCSGMSAYGLTAKGEVFLWTNALDYLLWSPGSQFSVVNNRLKKLSRGKLLCNGYLGAVISAGGNIACAAKSGGQVLYYKR